MLCTLLPDAGGAVVGGGAGGGGAGAAGGVCFAGGLFSGGAAAGAGGGTVGMGGLLLNELLSSFEGIGLLVPFLRGPPVGPTPGL